MTDFYEQLLENDLNPFLLFTSNGKIKSYNKEAEFLLNYVSSKELYELAVANANNTFGFKQKFISLHYNKHSYYALLVGYLNEEEIALRLYKEVTTQTTTINNNELKLVNIFTLIDLSKKSTLLNSNLQVKDLYDISIPEIRLNINQFLIILNECFKCYLDENTITLKVYIKSGEYQIINGKKYQIIIMEFISNNQIDIEESFYIKTKKLNIDVIVNKNSIMLEFLLDTSLSS